MEEVFLFSHKPKWVQLISVDWAGAVARFVTHIAWGHEWGNE